MPATRIKQSFVFLFGSKHPSVKTHLPFQPFQSLRGVAELASLKQSSHYIPQTSGFPLCFIMVRSCFKVTFQRLKDGGELVLLLNSRRFSNLRKGYVPHLPTVWKTGNKKLQQSNIGYPVFADGYVLFITNHVLCTWLLSSFANAQPCLSDHLLWDGGSKTLPHGGRGKNSVSFFLSITLITDCW